MRRRLFPNMIGDVLEIEERQERMERVMQILGITPEYPFTVNVNDGTRNRVMIGLIGADYGIQIVDNAGNSILLANGTIVANAIKSGTLDCSLITVTNLNAGSITTGSLSASIISGGTLNCNLMTVTNLNAGSITLGTFSNPNDRFTDEAINGVKITQNTIYGNRIVANSINADRIQAGTITADRITAKTITADRITDYSLGTNQMIANGVNADRIIDATITNAKIANLSADKITAGTFYVGYAGRPVAMYIAHGSSGDAKFWFEGGSRMWSDSSNRIGMNSIGSPMYIYVDSYEKIVIPSSGQVSIRGGVYCDGNLNVTSNTRFHNDVNFDGHTLNGCNVINNTTFNGNNIWYWNLYYYSDMALKKEVKIQDMGLVHINKLETIEFKYEAEKEGKLHYGFSAQEVEKSLPELVSENQEGIKGVKMIEMIPLLVNAVKELSAEVNILKAKIGGGII